ncbi:low molecular weight phosphotyrosine protein phosphatase [Candidatus Thioglobus sp.]|nr:low molecular weight phosphotyrosine protein phosphatase [Candidatus Thioglobus sp.]
MELKNKVLFVCMGNICRSPTAEGAFRSIVEKNSKSQYFEIDSAGTHAYHIGNSPDQRSQQAAINHGVDLSNQRARHVHESDFYYYDYIIAMDSDNLERLKSIHPSESHSKIELMLNYSKEHYGASVPDPYYEGKFDEVFEMLYSACTSFFESIVKKD